MYNLSAAPSPTTTTNEKSDIHQLTTKETKRQAITKDQKNEMKAKPIDF